MTISLDLHGTYFEHKEYFDVLAAALQAAGHRVGIITGERERDVYDNSDNREKFVAQLGFVPDFFHLWGQNETISNGAVWKVKKMAQEGVAVHYDDDARDIKRYTDLWVIKVLNKDDISKF